MTQPQVVTERNFAPTHPTVRKNNFILRSACEPRVHVQLRGSNGKATDLMMCDARTYLVSNPTAPPTYLPR